MVWPITAGGLVWLWDEHGRPARMASQRKVRPADFFVNKESRDEYYLLLQLRITPPWLASGWGVGVAVFPEREKVLARIPRARGGSFSLEHQHDTVAALRRLELRHNHRNQ